MSQQASKRKKHVHKSCKRKARLTQGQAQNLARNRGITYYRCPACKQYHLTSRGLA